MNTTAISDAGFEQSVLKSEALVLVDFWAEWCGPCRMIAPIVDSVAEQYNGQLKVVKLNVNENPATARAYGIHAIPTLLFFRGGQVVDRLMGVVPKIQLSIRINRLLQQA